MREETPCDPRVDARPCASSTSNASCTPPASGSPAPAVGIAHESKPEAESHNDSPSRFQAIRDTILHALSQHDRLLVVLWYVERMSIREIGEVLDLTDQQVRRAHERVVARLREATAPMIA